MYYHHDLNHEKNHEKDSPLVEVKASDVFCRDEETCLLFALILLLRCRNLLILNDATLTTTIKHSEVAHEFFNVENGFLFFTSLLSLRRWMVKKIFIMSLECE